MPTLLIRNATVLVTMDDHQWLNHKLLTENRCRVDEELYGELVDLVAREKKPVRVLQAEVMRDGLRGSS